MGLKKESASSTMKTLMADTNEATVRLCIRKVKEQAGKHDVIGEPKSPRRSRIVRIFFMHTIKSVQKAMFHQVKISIMRMLSPISGNFDMSACAH